jgi:hypothetical protein
MISFKETLFDGGGGGVCRAYLLFFLLTFKQRHLSVKTILTKNFKLQKKIRNS